MCVSCCSGVAIVVVVFVFVAVVVECLGAVNALRILQGPGYHIAICSLIMVWLCQSLV